MATPAHPRRNPAMGDHPNFKASGSSYYPPSLRSHSATSLPLSKLPLPSSASLSTTRIPISTVSRSQKPRTNATIRPSTAPGQANNDTMPPSAFTSKSRWLKRITALRSASPSPSPDKDAQFAMLDTASTRSASHSVASFHPYADDDDVDGFAGHQHFISAVTSAPPPSARTSMYTLDSQNGQRGFGRGRDHEEDIFDFLQALDITSADLPPVPKMQKSRSDPTKQAPPLIDLTGGIYINRNKLNNGAQVPPSPLPLKPIIVTPSSLSSSAKSATASTFTAASTLVDSPHRKSSSEGSTSSSSHSGTAGTPPSPVAVVLPGPSAIAPEDEPKPQIPNAPAAETATATATSTIPLVLPVTPKSNLTTRKRAPLLPPSSAIPRSVSSPEVVVTPDADCDCEREDVHEDGGVGSSTSEPVVGGFVGFKIEQDDRLLPARPARAVHASCSDPGLYLTWSSSAVVVPRSSTPSSPDMPSDESEQASSPTELSPTTDNGASIPPPIVPVHVLPRTPERAIVKLPRRQPQSPTTPTAPYADNLTPQVEIPALSSVSFPKSESEEPSTPKVGPEALPTTPPRQAITTTRDSPPPLPGNSTLATPSRTRETTADSTLTTATTSSSFLSPNDSPSYLKNISPEDIHVSQRTLLKPVVRKASDVSLKRFFDDLDQREGGESVGMSRGHGAESSSTARTKKGSLNGITGSTASSKKEKEKGSKPRRPVTAHAAVDLTKIKTSSIQMGPPLPLNPTAPTAPRTARTPLSTRRPRTATEPHRFSFRGPLNMDWDRERDPWDDPTFRSEGSVFASAAAESYQRTRAQSEVVPAAGAASSSLELGLGGAKAGKRSSVAFESKRPGTVDSSGAKGRVLKKKSLKKFDGQGAVQQPLQAMVREARRSIGAGALPHSPPPSTYRPSLDKEKHKVFTNPATSPDLSAIATFEPERALTMRDVYEASLINVWDKEGNKVQFGKLFEDQVTIVVFIRHFWCPMCQDYMKSIVKELEPGRLAQARVKLVVISCGDPAMIKSYNEKIIKSPFEMYTDPKLVLFNALGMTLKTTDGGPEELKGEYIKHGTFRGTLNVIGRALVSMSPGVIVKRGGDIKQLGGEFILGPGLRCRFSHRMSTTRNHAPIREIALKAGVQVDASEAPFIHFRTPSEEAEWAARRTGLKKKKLVRRASDLGGARPPLVASPTECGGDGEVCPVRTNHLVGTI